MKRAIQTSTFLALLFLVNGCINSKIEITTTKPWEGHYYTVDEFQSKTDNIQLSKGETIWVLSNTTLSRVLKNMKNQNNK